MESQSAHNVTHTLHKTSSSEAERSGHHLSPVSPDLKRGPVACGMPGKSMIHQRKEAHKGLFAEAQLEKLWPSLNPVELLCSVHTALHVADHVWDTAMERRTIRPGAPCSRWPRAAGSLRGREGPERRTLIVLRQCWLTSQYLLDMLLSVLRHNGSPAPQKCAFPFLVDDKVGRGKNDKTEGTQQYWKLLIDFQVVYFESCYKNSRAVMCGQKARICSIPAVQSVPMLNASQVSILFNAQGLLGDH